MKKYRVNLVKYETYYVDAENEDMAINAACLLCDDDIDAWTDPVDQFEVETVEEILK